MNFIKRLFSSKDKEEEAVSLPEIGVEADMHSHLLPALDDGSESMDESIELIKLLMDKGYKSLVTTPHVMGDFYQNTRDDILRAQDAVIEQIEKEGLDVQFSAAAEYYFDEFLIEKVKNKDILSFGDNYVLVETSFMNKPEGLMQIFFDLKMAGYRPVFAHPERYIYLYDDYEQYDDLAEKDILLQINLNSLSGYYSPKARDAAKYLIENKLVDFVGTDCHKSKHVEVLNASLKTNTARQLKDLELKNNNLLKQ